jgi:hypothetical protein
MFVAGEITLTEFTVTTKGGGGGGGGIFDVAPGESGRSKESCRC